MWRWLMDRFMEKSTWGAVLTSGATSASRANLGQQLTLAGHSTGAGTFASNQAFVGHAAVVMTSDEIAQSYLSVQLRLADLGIVV